MKIALRDFLKANTALNALVVSRIEWDVLPQGGSLPAIALHLISGPRDYTMQGRVGLTPYRVQMDVWAAARDSREAVRSALITALDGAPSGVFQALFIDNESSNFDPADGPGPTGSSKFFRARFDVIAWTTEA